MKNYSLYHGDCVSVLSTLPDCSVDAIVTDPPYGLGKEPDPVQVMTAWAMQGYFEVQGKGFMGKKWDAFVPQPVIWKEVFRVLKPGGHLLAFSGTRTQDWMAMSIRFAGFEIRDMIAWVYGSGFPKSMDVSKAIDKAAGVEREDKFEGVFERRAGPTGNKKCDSCGKWLVSGSPCKCPRPQDDAQTWQAKQWQGWGTALKPALEPITVARKPLIGTVAANVLQHGTGAINIDECRVDAKGDKLCGGNNNSATDLTGKHEGWTRPWMKDESARLAAAERSKSATQKAEALGRWPANFIHDGSYEVTALLGDAARFFYCAKASKADRNEGCEELDRKISARSCQAQAEAKRGNVVECEGGAFNKARLAHNHHPTVKPTDLMRYLCRLVTPPGGLILDPFMGSGSTGKAAMLEGFHFIGIEQEAEYLEIAKVRIAHAVGKTSGMLSFD